jgi:hypothetical protein
MVVMLRWFENAMQRIIFGFKFEVEGGRKNTIARRIIILKQR